MLATIPAPEVCSAEGKAPAMSRLTLFVLGVGLSLVVLVAIATPAPVRAAYVKLAYDASLQETPDDAGISLTMLPAAVVVTITGDPVGSYYPVTAGGKSGWVRGDALAFDDAADASPVEPVAAAPDLEAAVRTEPVGEEPAPVEPVANEPVPVETVAEDLAPAEPVADATPVAEPVAMEPAPADPAMQNPPIAAPVAEAAAPEPPLDPNAPTVDVPDPGPVGPAAVMADVAIYAGPGAEFGVLGTAAMGQLVEQTGHAVSGYVTVRYVDVTGWVPLDHLGPPPTADSSASVPQTDAQS